MILALMVATGFLLVRAAWPNALRWCRHDVLRLSLGVGLGLFLASMVTFATDALFGGSANFARIADLTLFAAALAWYAATRRDIQCQFCSAPSQPAGWLPAAAAVAALGCAAVSFILFTIANPLGEWDAWAIWNNHARFLAGGAHWRRMFSPGLEWSAQDYPLLVPGAIANAWMGALSRSNLVPAVVAALFLASAAGVVFGAIDLLRGRTQACIALTTLFGAAAIVRMGASQYADVPLAFFYVAAAALLSIADSIPARIHCYWLAGAMAGCAAWTKNEGLVFVCVLFAARAVSREWKSLIWLAAGSLPPLAIVAWFKLAYAPANYLFTERQPVSARLGDVSRYMTVAVEFGGWLALPLVIAAGYLWLVGRSGERAPGRTTALATLIAMTAAYFGVYLVTTKDLNWQIETSLSRVLMQLWPLAVLVFFQYASGPTRQNSKRARN